MALSTSSSRLIFLIPCVFWINVTASVFSFAGLGVASAVWDVLGSSRSFFLAAHGIPSSTAPLVFVFLMFSLILA